MKMIYLVTPASPNDAPGEDGGTIGYFLTREAAREAIENNAENFAGVVGRTNFVQYTHCALDEVTVDMLYPQYNTTWYVWCWNAEGGTGMYRETKEVPFEAT